MLNRERIGSVDGPEDQIFGWAEIKDASKPGELVVHLQTVHFGAPYWVFKLGPETYGPDGLYQYSIVSDPFQVRQQHAVVGAASKRTATPPPLCRRHSLSLRAT